MRRGRHPAADRLHRGKGNLIQRDYGKMAFTFYPPLRRQGPARPAQTLGPPLRPESRRQRKVNEGNGSPEDKARLLALRDEAKRALLELPLEDVFEIQPPATPIPRGPSILESLVCADCGEMIMESRTRRLEGRTLCIPHREGRPTADRPRCPAPAPRRARRAGPPRLVVLLPNTPTPPRRLPPS